MASFPKMPVKRMRTKQQADAAKDRAGSAGCKKRSEGRCEIVTRAYVPYRCQRQARHVHHMIGGRGKRGIGISALAEHKQHVCMSCHQDITGDIGGKRLVRVGGTVPVFTDHYRRIRKAVA